MDYFCIYFLQGLNDRIHYVDKWNEMNMSHAYSDDASKPRILGRDRLDFIPLDRPADRRAFGTAIIFLSPWKSILLLWESIYLFVYLQANNIQHTCKKVFIS